MGKIRTKTIGLEEVEEKQKKDAQVRREQKKKREKEPEIKIKEAVKPEPTTEAKKPTEKKEKRPAPKTVKKTPRGTGYQKAKKLIKQDSYDIEAAIALLPKIKFAHFDETVELHLNVTETGLKKEVTLPHGTGKAIKVVICDEALIDKIAKGNLDFDVLITHPSYMPKLVKYAKVLGPKGLMPNPKRGTLTDKPEAARTKFQKGGLTVKTEAKFPLIHQAVGKISFGGEKIRQNLEAVIKAFPKGVIISAYVKTTMSPAIRLRLD